MKKLFVATVVAMGLWATAAPAADEFKVDDEGFIRNWLVLPSISLRPGFRRWDAPAVFDKHFKDQNTAMPKAGDKVEVDGKELTWLAIDVGAGYGIDRVGNSVLNLTQVCSDAGMSYVDALILGVCYITADEDMKDLKLKVGGDNCLVFRLNDTELPRQFHRVKIAKDLYTFEVTLKKGCNVLRWGSAQTWKRHDPLGVCARFVDKDDKPVTNIKVSLTPPAK